MNEQILLELQEQSKWLRFLGMQALRPILEQTLSSSKQRQIYELSDGNTTVRQIASQADISLSTVSQLWKSWIQAGICIESATQAGRACHLVSLGMVGISLDAETE